MIRNVNSIFELTKSTNLNSIQKRTSFYNKYKHGPTSISNPKPDYGQWFKDFFGREGIEFVKSETNRILRKPFRNNLGKDYEYNETHKFEDFDSDESIRRWKPVADSDSLNGFSVSSFVRSPSGHGLFKGFLDNRLPEDGMTMKSGHAGIIGPKKPRDSLFRFENHWDWSKFNCLEIRFRGDGRKYSIILNTGSYESDLSYYDFFGFPLYTRGGPYWQTYRIPFSRFVYASHGMIQDEQGPLPHYDIKFVAVTLEDSFNGPFSLEIDYIGLRKQCLPFDEFTSYESYATQHVRWRPLQVCCSPPDQHPE